MRILARPKKHRETNTDDLITQLIETVTDAYLNHPENTADENGWMYLNFIAEEFSMTSIKVRKILISSGLYQTPKTVNAASVKYNKTKKRVDVSIDPYGNFSVLYKFRSVSNCFDTDPYLCSIFSIFCNTVYKVYRYIPSI